jgi:hypothetical protein
LVVVLTGIHRRKIPNIQEPFMSDKSKLPFSEASGKKPLHGTYKVSFTINVDSEDDVLASDIGLFLSQGLGDSLIEKVSAVDVEKIYKTAKVELKPGDLVYLNRDVEVKATVVKDNNGIYCVGSLGDTICENYTLSFPRGIVAEVNKTAEGKAELVGFENDVEASFIDSETDEPFNEYVRIDVIAVDLDAVEKLENNPNPVDDEGVA